MLILQRRIGQRVFVGDEVEITIAAIGRHGVRLAIVAPRGVAVLRGEVHDAVVAANLAAASCEDAFEEEEAPETTSQDAPPPAHVRATLSRHSDQESR